MSEVIREHISTVEGGTVCSAESIKTRAEQLDSTAIQSIEKKINQLPLEIGEILGLEERKYLTILGQKDETTLAHSLGVSEIAHEQLSEFKEDLDKEGISPETFIRAAALHDVGKLSLPDCVLKGTMTWKDFEDKFFALRKTDPDFINQRLQQADRISSEQNVEDLNDEQMRGLGLNYRDFVSLQQCFADDPASLQEIRAYGLNSEVMSFMDALRIHEKKSTEIIKQTDIPDKEQIAELAGSHHHYTKEAGEQFSRAKEVLRVSVLASELLHLADVYHAIKQPRSYKKLHSEVEALHIIMNEAKQGVFQLDIVKRWIKHMLEVFEKQTYRIAAEELPQYEEVQRFIETEPVKVSTY